MAISRRDFIKTGASATAAASLASPVAALTQKRIRFEPGPYNTWPGRYVLNYNNTQNCTPTGGDTDDETIVKKMVDDSIKLLTGEITVGAAWKTIFPDTLSQSSKIAIKINILNQGLPPHPFVVMGITEGLQQMDVGGSNFPAGNIFIYDANNKSSYSGSGYSSTRFPGIDIRETSISNHGDGAYSNKNYADTLSDCDFLINIPGLRGHSLSCAEGFTLGFKSHYGTYANPGSYHSSSGRNFLQTINCEGPVYNKNVLTVLGAIQGHNEGSGPGGSATSHLTYAKTKDPDTSNASPNTIVLCTDPVTLEFQAIKIMRVNKNKSYALDDLPNYLRASAGITGLLTETFDIGILEEALMKYAEVVNEKIIFNSINPTDNKMNPKSHKKIDSSVQVISGPNNRSAFIEFVIPDYYIGNVAQVSIIDSRGRTVRKLSQKLLGIRTRAVWNGLDTIGKRAAAGRYVIKIQIDTLSFIKSISII